MSRPQGLDFLTKVKSVSRETQERLTDYCTLLTRWQARINLISPTTVDQIWQRHMADSAQCVDHVKEARHLVDIGSGAGFPGLVMAIILSETREGKIDLVESNGKKCAFLNAVVRETGLNETDFKVRVHHGRIEDVLPDLDRPDLISARALAPLPDLLKLTSSVLKDGTIGLFPKGRGYREEIEAAKRDWQFQWQFIPSCVNHDSAILKISDVHPLLSNKQDC